MAAKNDAVCVKTNEDLSKAFEKYGKRYGYEEVKAEFLPFPDFKVRWQRTFSEIDFRVSDYLIGAPVKVLEDLAKSIFMRIAGEDDSYSDELFKHVTKPDFVEAHQDLYLSRILNIVSDDEYKEAVDRAVLNLEEMGLIDDSWLDHVVILSRLGAGRKMGGCSVLMKTVTLSTRLMDGEFSDNTIAYVLYNELAHIKLGFDPNGTLHSDGYLKLVKKYPLAERDKAEYELRCNSVHI